MPTVIGAITPTDPSDTYPVLSTQYLKGGTQTWFAATGDWLSTAILPTSRREAGMIVSSADAPTVKWQLGADLTTWTQFNSSAAGNRVTIIPDSVLDPTGGVNPIDPTTVIQGYIDNASAAYNATDGPMTLVFPAGSITMGEFIAKGNVTYVGGGLNGGGVTHIKKRYDYTTGSSFTSNVNRVIFKTVRKPYVNVDPNDKCFLSWVYPNADDWYGNSDNMTFAGRFIFDQNNKLCGLHLCMFFEVRNMLVLPGAFEVWHTPNAPVGNRWWGIYLCGRDIRWYSPIVRYGTEVYQDGFHFVSGDRITVQGGYIECGDDAFAISQQTGSATTIGPDEGVTNVVVNGTLINSQRGRAITAQAGANFANVPFIYGGRCNNITYSNITGKAAQYNSHGISIANYRRPTERAASTSVNGVFSNAYQIVAAGSGYANGFYPNLSVTPVTGTGSGAKACVTIAGGIVTRVMPDQVTAGDFLRGSNYNADARVDLSTIPHVTTTTTTAGFTMPAVSSNVTVSVASVAPFSIGDGVWIATAGYFTVAAVGVSTLDLTNLGHYQNAAPATVIATAKQVAESTAANLVAPLVALDNTLVDNVNMQATLTIGSTTHNNIEPWGFSLQGARNIKLDCNLTIIQNTGSPAHRPFYIRGCDRAKIRMVLNTQLVNGGLVTTKDNNCGVIDNLEFHDSYFLNPTSGGSGIIKLANAASNSFIGKISVKSSVIDKLDNGCSFIYIDSIDGTDYGTLELIDNKVIPTSLTPSNDWFVRFLTPVSNMMGLLIMRNNDLRLMSRKINASPTDFQLCVTKYLIKDNPGLSTKQSKAVTIGAATTTQSITVDNLTGLPDLTTLAFGGVFWRWVTQPTNVVGNTWFTTSSVTAFNINFSTAPGGAGATGIITIDTSQKGLAD